MTREIVLVVAAHPDDEVLGCGGTMARHASCGDEVHIVIVAEGATSRQGHPANGTTELRNATESAAHCLGVSSVTALGLPDNRLDSMDLLDLVQLIEPIYEQLCPTVMYTHHYGDLNVDHVQVSRAVSAVARPLPESNLRSLLLFEVPSSTGWAAPTDRPFLPNWYVDVTQWVEHKRKALLVYETEMREYPHARSHAAVESLTRFRGSSVGVHAAEAFELHRHVRRAPDRTTSC